MRIDGRYCGLIMRTMLRVKYEYRKMMGERELRKLIERKVTE